MRHSHTGKWAVPTAAALLVLFLTIDAFADVAPELPPEPESPDLPFRYAIMIAGCFLALAIASIGYLLIRRKETAGLPVCLVAATVLIGVGAYVGWTVHQDAEYERQLQEREAEVRRIYREHRDYRDRWYAKRKQMGDERRRNQKSRAANQQRSPVDARKPR